MITTVSVNYPLACLKQSFSRLVKIECEILSGVMFIMMVLRLSLVHHKQISTCIFLAKYSSVLSADTIIKKAYLLVRNIIIWLQNKVFTASIIVFSENVL